MIDFSCAFTGHRPHKFPWGYNETTPDCVKLKQALAEQITALANAGVLEFLSGMAEGADTWAAQTVLALRNKNPALKLHCVLPCESQADRWKDTAREQYFLILSQADKTTYISRNYTEGCMLERNRYLVDHAGVLLAIYNGEQRGGTAATLRYARKKNRAILILDPLTQRVIREGFAEEPT